MLRVCCALVQGHPMAGCWVIQAGGVMCVEGLDTDIMFARPPNHSEHHRPCPQHWGSAGMLIASLAHPLWSPINYTELPAARIASSCPALHPSGAVATAPSLAPRGAQRGLHPCPCHL